MIPRWQHLNKMFEAIKQLEFDDGLNIHAMTSSEGERVPFQSSGEGGRPNGEGERRPKAPCRTLVCRQRCSGCWCGAMYCCHTGERPSQRPLAGPAHRLQHRGLDGTGDGE